MLEAAAEAHVNIALVKYWGKRDVNLNLPIKNSIAMTLDKLSVTMHVEFRDDLSQDDLVLNGIREHGVARGRAARFLDHIRGWANERKYARVTSVSRVPVASGLASSAAAFAALSLAASSALGLRLQPYELSRLARRGSGSAARSIYGGFSEWAAGLRSDGEDSYAHQLLGEQEWDLCALVVLVKAPQKSVSSREGMIRVATTSPFFTGWLASLDNDLDVMRRAIRRRNFEMLGETAERNALKMHATTLGANPPFLYWCGATLDVILRVSELRRSGLMGFATIDAGPHVVVLCRRDQAALLTQEIRNVPGVVNVIPCGPGPGVRNASVCVL